MEETKLKHSITKGQKNLMLSRGWTLQEIDERFELVDKLPAQEPRKRAPIPRLEQLRGRLIAGLLTESEFIELKKLREPEEKQAAQDWEFQKITHQSAAGLITESRYLEKRNGLREQIGHDDRKVLLTEQQQCSDPCDCPDCDLKSCLAQLDEAIARGQLSKPAAERMWQRRLSMD